mgnify:CR=1 FL=1
MVVNTLAAGGTGVSFLRALGSHLSRRRVQERKAMAFLLWELEQAAYAADRTSAANPSGSTTGGM